MSQLSVWAAASDLPVHLLAVIGAFTVGGFLGGWGVAVAAKLAFNQKLPNWLSWAMRLLCGLVAGWLVWMWLFGPGGGGGGGNGWWPGGTGTSGTTGEKDKGSDKTGKPDKTPDPVTPPKEKDLDDKSKPDGPGIGSGESIRVEVLGNGPLEKLARGGKMDLEKRYRIADAPATLRTFAEIKKLILERRSQTPPLRKLDVVIYLDSPDQASSPVKGLVEWARDIEPGLVGALEVEEKFPARSAPLK